MAEALKPADAAGSKTPAPVDTPPERAAPDSDPAAIREYDVEDAPLTDGEEYGPPAPDQVYYPAPGDAPAAEPVLPPGNSAGPADEAPVEPDPEPADDPLPAPSSLDQTGSAATT